MNFTVHEDDRKQQNKLRRIIHNSEKTATTDAALQLLQHCHKFEKLWIQLGLADPGEYGAFV